jgi:hypothetical protein
MGRCTCSCWYDGPFTMFGWLAPPQRATGGRPKKPGNAEFAPIEEAPGSHVKEKAP